MIGSVYLSPSFLSHETLTQDRASAPGAQFPKSKGDFYLIYFISQLSIALLFSPADFTTESCISARIQQGVVENS